MTDFTSAPCRGALHLFFDEDDFTEARAVCATCPRWMRQACYRQGVIPNTPRSEAAGVFGGYPEHQRRVMRADFRVPIIFGVHDPSTNREPLADKVQRALDNPRRPFVKPSATVARLEAELVGRPYVCECGDGFVTAYGLRVHRGLVHRVAS